MDGKDCDLLFILAGVVYNDDFMGWRLSYEYMPCYFR